MITVISNGSIVGTNTIKFPSGESMIALSSNAPGFNDYKSNFMVEMKFQATDDLIQLVMIVDAIRRQYGEEGSNITLFMPFLPYARQDRVCNKGEPLAVKVVCDLINSLGFFKVIVRDVHSEVGCALLNNLVHMEQYQCFGTIKFLIPEGDVVLVSPDAGANKKVFKLAQYHGYDNVVRADKTRDIQTGNITGTVVYSEHIGNSNFLIVDDICDGGRTFIELAKKLRPLTNGKIYLYVTHGIFTKGYEELKQHIDLIITANMMGQEDKDFVKHP